MTIDRASSRGEEVSWDPVPSFKGSEQPISSPPPALNTWNSGLCDLIRVGNGKSIPPSALRYGMCILCIIFGKVHDTCSCSPAHAAFKAKNENQLFRCIQYFLSLLLATSKYDSLETAPNADHKSLTPKIQSQEECYWKLNKTSSGTQHKKQTPHKQTPYTSIP